MGGGGGKGGKGGGSGQKSYDYFGGLAAVLGCGQVDTLHSALADQKEFWTGPISSGVGNPYTLAITDPKWLASGGFVKHYWGGQTAVDAFLADHPPLKAYSFTLFRKFFCGTERQTFPNLQLIASRKAHPPTDILSQSSLVNDCANPFEIAAEVLCSIHGLGLDPARLDVDSWNEARDWCAANGQRKLLTYCAPLLNDFTDARSFFKTLFSLADAAPRLKDDGTIEIKLLDPDPGDLADYRLLTENDFIKPPDLTHQTWDDVPTGVVVSFADKTRLFKTTPAAPVDNLTHPLALTESKREKIDLSGFCTSEDQAHALAADFLKRHCRPKCSGRITVRRERATNLDGSRLRKHDRFRLDIDPEPGGDGLAQLCRVLEVRYKLPGGAATISFESEPNQPAVPFTPTYTPPDFEAMTVANIVNARIVPIVPSLSDGMASVVVLASRPDDLVVGAHVLFDVDGGAGVFAEIGQQIGFAVRAKLTADYDAGSGDVPVTLLDLRDQHLALQDLGPSAAQNDELLMVILKDDGGGFVDEAADGFPIMEIFSIDTYSAVSGNDYFFTALPARRGTTQRDWDADDEVWIIPRSSLEAVTHKRFTKLAQTGDDFFLELRAYSRFAECEDVLNDFNFRFPSAYRPPQIVWTTPADNPHNISSDSFTPVATATDPNGNLVRLELFSVREDTGVQTKHLDVPFAQRNSITIAEALAIAGGTYLSGEAGNPLGGFAAQATLDTNYYLTLRATDKTGFVVESAVILVRAASGTSTSLPTVTMSNLGGHQYRFTTTAPADRIDWSLDYSFRAAAPSGGAEQNPAVFAYYPDFIRQSGLSFDITIGSGFRFWVRSRNSTNSGTWIYFDFYSI